MVTRIFVVVLILTASIPALAEDSRQRVEMPDMMRDHMLGNMRDHLLALETITRQLANQEYDEAADVAETRLGMSSMESHGASHMGQFMPQEMSAIGTEMHHAASRFSIAAKDAAIEGGLNKAFSALSEVMQQCVACHSGYRVH
ncbi:MAG: hypothetical protein GY934_05965 [Gammaproteobacteria bacterium]|nr:hypothetical protein [Gammaproteobacteria bacterium]